MYIKELLGFALIPRPTVLHHPLPGPAATYSPTHRVLACQANRAPPTNPIGSGARLPPGIAPPRAPLRPPLSMAGSAARSRRPRRACTSPPQRRPCRVPSPQRHPRRAGCHPRLPTAVAPIAVPYSQPPMRQMPSLTPRYHRARRHPRVLVAGHLPAVPSAIDPASIEVRNWRVCRYARGHVVPADSERGQKVLLVMDSGRG